MKVLLVSPASNIHTQRWANGLVGRGIEVEVASWHAPLEGYAAEVTHRDLPRKGGLGYFLNGPFLAKLVERSRPDMVNVHYASGYGSLARWIHGCPILLSVWGSDVYDFPEISPLHRWWLKGNLAKADGLASTSHAMARHTMRWCPAGREIAVTPFGIDLGKFPLADRSGSEETIRIGTIKTLLPKYGIDILLKAFASLRERSDPAIGRKLRLEIVGGGDSRAELESLAESLGIRGVTEFVGKIPHAEVPARLSGFDVYVALSRLDSESFGVAILEASACGVPVVVSDVGGLPEVVKAGETGLVVPREDPEAAAEAIATLVSDPELGRRMGAAGRAHVEREYSWEKSLDTMLETYQNLLTRIREGRKW